ncbi:signal peptidase I [Streptomyces sp. NPDC048442]|uniref:signal peptidase I n=1 Tax=Streptomyces sp. NPDC048442 TaxID=3154823 RepID=UPI00341A9E74
MAVGARSGHDGPEEKPEPERRADASPSVTPGPAREQRSGEELSDNGSQGSGTYDGGTYDGGAHDDGGEDGHRGSPKKPRSFWKELPLLIGIALILALLIKTFLVQAFSIPSESMQETLQKGDRVLVDKLTPWFGAEPERGEVVVFHDPGNWLNTPVEKSNVVQDVLSFIGLMPSAEDKDLIKRVIAVGGDTVECKTGGSVTVNGKTLDDKSYISPQGAPCDDQPFGPLKVPDGKIWVMGDNRTNSEDSRYHQNLPTKGFVNNEQVVGRAVVVAWPISRWATLPVPDTFEQSGLASATAAAASAAPGALGLAGALPVVLWRRRRLTRGRTAG